VKPRKMAIVELPETKWERRKARKKGGGDPEFVKQKAAQLTTIHRGRNRDWKKDREGGKKSGAEQNDDFEQGERDKRGIMVKAFE